jgi:hypothetical protein
VEDLLDCQSLNEASVLYETIYIIQNVFTCRIGNPAINATTEAGRRAGEASRGPGEIRPGKSTTDREEGETRLLKSTRGRGLCKQATLKIRPMSFTTYLHSSHTLLSKPLQMSIIGALVHKAQLRARRTSLVLS